MFYCQLLYVLFLLLLQLKLYLRVDLYKKYSDTSCFINKHFLFTNHYILSKQGDCSAWYVLFPIDWTDLNSNINS